MSTSSCVNETMSSSWHLVRAGLAGCAVLLLAACGESAPSPDADQQTAPAAAQTPAEGVRVLAIGGGSSHDFDAYFHRADSATLAEVGAEFTYVDDPSQVLGRLQGADVLYLTTNQPLPDPALRAAILDLPARGTGLIIGHAGAWYNWEDWPEYNRTLVGGGTRGHRSYGEFTVEVTQPDHPIMEGVPASFTLADELYWFERDDQATDITVLATARDEERDTVYPIVWTVNVPEGRVVVNTLGHDAAAHDHPAYRRILQNSLAWVGEEGS